MVMQIERFGGSGVFWISVMGEGARSHKCQRKWNVAEGAAPPQKIFFVSIVTSLSAFCRRF